MLDHRLGLVPEAGVEHDARAAHHRRLRRRRLPALRGLRPLSRPARRRPATSSPTPWNARGWRRARWRRSGWLAGPAPPQLAGTVGRARIVERVAGVDGALAAVAAAETVARTAAPAVAASLPGDGTHVAVVLAPVRPSA
jgi:hypothetical protein